MPLQLPWQKQKPIPTLLHITHIKAGSTWVDRLLRELFKEKVRPRFGSDLFNFKESSESDPLQHPPYLEMFQATAFYPGHVYPSMFITHREFVSRPEFSDSKRFVIIRDLRDAFTSHYFSLKATHALDKLGRVKTARDHLQTASKDDGFLFLFERDLDRLVEIQSSWLSAGELVLRYEDLITGDVEGFTELFVGKLQLPVTPKQVRRAVDASRFETVYKRKLGEVDENSHGRQGLPGDWRNHFSPAVRQAFAARAGDLLIRAGYEQDASWVSA